jgi:hypothetical protein
LVLVVLVALVDKLLEHKDLILHLVH